MKKELTYLSVVLSLILSTTCSGQQSIASTVVALPPQFPIEGMQAISNETYTLAEAKEDFNSFRRSMGYLDAAGRSQDSKSGYYDISTETLTALLKEAGQQGWTKLRIYHGLDRNGEKILIVNGLNVDGNGKLQESAKSGSELVVKVSDASFAPGSECPRWCDISSTALGK